jgi:hypothetical protein
MRRLCGLTTLSLALSVSSAWAVQATGSMTAEEVNALAREVSAKVEQIRGARFTRPVSVRVVDPATARAHFHARLLKFWPPDQVRYDQRVYEQLGLLKPGTDLMKTLLDVLEEQAGAYYDPENDTFFVLKGMPRATAPVLMAHELTHALDDQRFNIDGTLAKLKEDDDRATAYSAVVEGTGTVVMSLFMLQEIQAGRLSMDAVKELQKSEAGQAAKLQAAPALIQRSLIAPYQLGQAFLLHGDPAQYASFRPSDADRAFKDPPQSSEQIIHSEKYWDPARRDAPKIVNLPDLASALGPGWKQVATGTLGELTLAVLAGLGPVDLASTKSAEPQNWTNRAATGWGGDTYQHYVNGQRGLTVLVAVWDTQEDAAEFTTALKPLPGRSVTRHGDTAVVLAGDAPMAAEALADTVFLALAKARAAGTPTAH